MTQDQTGPLYSEDQIRAATPTAESHIPIQGPTDAPATDPMAHPDTAATARTQDGQVDLMDIKGPGWHNPNNIDNGYQQRVYNSRKVGHILQVGTDWKGFYDGNHVGTVDTPEQAQRLADERAAQ